MRAFNQTSAIVIKTLKSLGVTVEQDADTAEYYALDCSKDGVDFQFSAADVDSLFDLNDARVIAYLAKYVSELKPADTANTNIFGVKINRSIPYSEFD